MSLYRSLAFEVILFMFCEKFNCLPVQCTQAHTNTLIPLQFKDLVFLTLSEHVKPG